jgi:hypothetical protein
MKKLTILIAMLMATSAWTEWTKTCKSEDGTYSETASLLYDNEDWSYTQQKYREGKKYTIKFSTLTNLQPPLGDISSLKTEYWVRCPIDFDNFDPTYGFYETKKIKDVCFSKINAKGEKLCEEGGKEEKLTFMWSQFISYLPFGKVAVDLCGQLEINLHREKYPETFSKRNPPLPLIPCNDKLVTNIIENISGR